MALEIVIITGLSGGGKSVAIKSLEDMGFFCIDNLPPSLLMKMLELSSFSDNKIERIGVVIDVRGRLFFEELRDALDFLEREDIPHRIIFLEASDEALIRRFKETRRMHPLSVKEGITASIKEERKLLHPIKERADLVIDTSDLTVHQLREHLQRYFSEITSNDTMQVILISFGYKYGIPLDADIVFDVRFLPNPFWVAELKELSGFDNKVEVYVLDKPEAKKFISEFQKMLRFLIPLYVAEGKTFLTIAIGCTGGRHRSVVISEKLAVSLRKMGMNVFIRHRDVDRR